MSVFTQSFSLVSSASQAPSSDYARTESPIRDAQYSPTIQPVSKHPILLLNFVLSPTLTLAIDLL